MAKDPICGMFVEEGPHALTATLHGTRYFFCSECCLVQFQAPEKALAQLKRLLVIGTVLTVPITALTYLPFVPSNDINNLVMFLLSIPVEFVLVFRFYCVSCDALLLRIGIMDLLIAMWMSAAWRCFIIVTLFSAFISSIVT